MTLAPHAHDRRLDDISQLATATQKLMADPASRPQSITYASDDFGLLRLLYKADKGACADQYGTVMIQWNSQWERPELWLFDLHHHLFGGDVGELVIGIVALCGLFFVITGLYHGGVRARLLNGAYCLLG